MLWILGTERDEIGENQQGPHATVVRLWTTVENSGIAICALTCANHT
jgi:hypothetical protein